MNISSAVFRGPKGTFPPSKLSNSLLVLVIVQLSTIELSDLALFCLDSIVSYFRLSTNSLFPIILVKIFQKELSTIPNAICPSLLLYIPNGTSKGCPFPSGLGIELSKSY